MFLKQLPVSINEVSVDLIVDLYNPLCLDYLGCYNFKICSELVDFLRSDT